MHEPTVSAGYAGGMLEFASSKGASRGALLERSGIEPRVLQDPDNRIPFAFYVALVRAAEELTDDPALALHFGEAVGIEAISIVGLIGQASETMLDAFAQLNRYVRLVVDLDDRTRERFELERGPDGLWLVDTRPDANEFPELTESAFAQLVCAPRRLGVPEWVRQVHVTHAEPAYRDEYERIFGAPIVFEAGWNAIEIDEAVTGHRIGLLPRYVFGVLTDHADSLLAELEGSRSTRSSVERLVMPILHTGDVKMDAIAARLGVSRQTLFRRLKADGVTFEQLLDELRHTMAVRYLSAAKVSVNETAYLVGFSDPAAFSRAFKRWTGSSPRFHRGPR